MFSKELVKGAEAITVAFYDLTMARCCSQIDEEKNLMLNLTNVLEETRLKLEEGEKHHKSGL